MAKKKTEKKARKQADRAVLRGVWLRWNGRDHVFSRSSTSTSPENNIVFVEFKCTCGVEPAILGLDLEAARKTARSILAAVKALEDGAGALPVPTVPGVGHA
jgi:hypothetical protein